MSAPAISCTATEDPAEEAQVDHATLIALLVPGLALPEQIYYKHKFLRPRSILHDFSAINKYRMILQERRKSEGQIVHNNIKYNAYLKRQI